MLRKYSFYILFILFSFLGVKSSYGQCPQFFDSQGVLSATPQWVSCSGGIFILFIQPDIAVGNYTIDWGDGTPNDNGASIIPPASVTHNYAATVANYTVTITMPGVPCVVTGQVIMEEPSNASIQIPFGGLTTTCAPGSLDFINSSTDVSTNTIFTWDFGDGSPIQTFNSTNAGQTVSHLFLQGTVNCVTQVTLTAENVCNTLQGGQSVATFNPIRIFDLDNAAITASATLLCYTDTVVTLDNTTNRNCLAQGNIAQRYEYWNLGDYWGQGVDSIIDWTPWPPTFTQTLAYPGIGTYTAMLVDSSFCGLDTAFITIQIVPPPTAALAISKDTICEGELVTLTNLAGGGANSYLWNFGDGTGWNNLGGGNVNYSYNFSGNYTIQLAVFITGGTASCTDTANIPVVVLPSPVANFNFDNNNGCDSMIVNYTDFSTGGIVTWQWDFGNGNFSSLQNPPAQFYGAPGTYNVQLDVTSTNGCPNTLIQQVDVFQSPVPAFIPTSVCQNEIASFTDQSTSSVGDPIIAWNWDFGDGNFSTQQNPTHVYTTSGPINVILDVSTAFCSASDTITVTVETAPIAGFNPDVTAGCSPLGINFTNTSSANAVTYLWDFGDGNTSTAANPTYIYVNSFGVDTTYTVTLIAQTTFGCADTTSQTITVYPNPIASFTDNSILDCAPLNVNFTNTTSGAVSYLWDFGDGTPTDTATNPLHIYNNLTLFIQNNIVTLIATSINGCTDTIIDSVLVYPEPQFGFSTNPDSGCSPLIVIFPSVLGAVQYQWDFGDGTTGTGPTPAHTYTNLGPNDTTYIIQLIATSPFGCTDTTYGQVLVFPIPTAAFTPFPVTQIFPSATVTVNNASTGAITYLWDFGDASPTSTALNPPAHVYSTWGTYITTLIESNGNCFDTTTQTITIIAPTPIAGFQGPAQGCMPLDVQFTNNSQFADTYLWDFGDGSTSTQTAPSYTYFSPGIFTVTLTATGPGGQDVQTQQLIIEVYQNPIAFFTVSPTTVFIPTDPVLLFNLSSFASSYFWNFGDGNTSTDVNPQHIYTQTGVYDIMLIASTPNNCIDTFILSAAVEALSDGGISIPNAFTPSEGGGNGGLYNGNETNNDVFHPIIIGADEYELNIFNKWGELLFISKDVNIGWDGYYRNELSKQDVYVYKIQVLFIDGRAESFTGDVTLLR